MNIVLFAHPAFMVSQSMPRFASMLQEAYLARGHHVQMWSPQARVYNWMPKAGLRKWAGYIDQYMLFPMWVRKQLQRQSADTLYVFCDQAMGPWMPLVKDRPHVVHVHDLLALRSALGDIPENRTLVTGKLYQRYIRWGFKQAQHFISISNKTREDLHHFGQVLPVTSEVVYNGLNHPYSPMPADQAARVLQQANLPAPTLGMLLHVSGNQWYKNVPGVVRLYAHYARNQQNPLPLWLIGNIGGSQVQAALAEVPPQGTVLFFKNLDNPTLQAAYSLSRALLFPSLAEGFGWPIIEAQACGCPVITTDDAPMNEVGGPASCYLPRLTTRDDPQVWAAHGATVLNALLTLDAAERQILRAQCCEWAGRFNQDAAIEGYLRVYRRIVERDAAPPQLNPSQPQSLNHND